MLFLIIGIILSVFGEQTLTEKCITPNKEQAKCVSLYSCHVLVDALASRKNASIEFVRRSNCGGTPTDPLVCCGSSSSFASEDSTTVRSQNVSKLSLLPTRRYCGYQHSDDYFHLENDTSIKITELPWVARLFYIYDDSTPTALCAGSLINNRYVLTAAHCIVSRHYGSPVGVQLGEYHVNNKTDCVQEPTFERECSEQVTEVGVEETIVHPNYIWRKHSNDIALIRLNRTISYTDYIRPVCLPLPGSVLAKEGDILTSSGFGRRTYAGDAVEIKKKYLSTLITTQQCAKAYSSRRINIEEDHLCTISLSNGTDFQCQGDTGAPLLFSNRNQWHQEGVSSFGVDCSGIIPDVYTKVVNYLDWILENIRT